MQNPGLDALLNPNSIAIIGASTDPNKISGRSIHYLNTYGYSGKVYPINPKYEEVQGHRSYSSLFDIPGEVDLVLIAISAKHVIKTLNECVQKKVKACIIFSSGFAELGEEGRKIQEQISEIAKTSTMRIVGPNCQGISNLKTRSTTSFSTSFADEKLAYGSTATISQSGAVAAMAYNIQKDYGRGVKYWIATGNESDVNVQELVHYIVDDPDIKVVQAYFEDVKDGELLIEAAKKARQLKKPILALKPGKSDEAKKAASSHTGALAGEDIVFDAICQQYGIVRVDDIMELSTFPQIFELDKKIQGKKVAILTNSGGLGVMMVDKCKELGLEIAQFSEETLSKLDTILPEFAATENPIDLTAQLLNDKQLLSNAFPILMEDSQIDIILVAFSGIGKGYDIAGMINDIAKASKEGDKMLAVSWVASEKGVIEAFGEKGIPAFPDPTLMIKGVAKFADYQLRSRRDIENSTVNETAKPISLDSYARDSSNGFLSEYNSKRILKKWSLPVTKEGLANSADEAAELANAFGYPVVMKVSSEFIQHKTESGGVRLNIQNADELREAYESILQNSLQVVDRDQIEGILVQEMVQEGFEISLGLKKDPIFGPVIMVASGGIYIEVIKDFRLLVPPVTYDMAKQAVDSLAMAPLLNGVRGKAKLDVDALCRTIISFSQMIQESGDQLEEVDMNPVMVMEEGQGVRIVDALFKLKELNLIKIG
ncbi:acetate--CoA ligase family protein [Aeromicrobium ponti]|uniref:Acetyltransferase n=1 Tax=Cytobacillus oceanisediminis TaxID=665099 RepID=A0A562JRA3_9BACI|nr:acetate--CoA ligase family protein [Cytobacillus oceanisediminis]TWH85720.1 acetyltransferase [Cytobacillus oceanisediminis]